MSTILISFPMMILSYILCLFSNSWILIWILLELNTLSFCTTMTKMKTESKKKNKENIMKYLIIQSIASSVLIFSTLMNKTSNKMKTIMTLLMITSILTKMAAAPFFQWMINILKQISWNQNLILLTWQKLAPLYLLMYLKKKMMFVIILITMTIGSLLMFNKTMIKEIIALSSLFNLSWVMLAIMIKLNLFILTLITYWIITIMTIMLFNQKNQENLKTSELPNQKKEMTLLALMSLAGIPPLLGFLFKWIILSEMLLNEMKLMMTLILTISTINLYVYLRIINSIMTSKSNSSQKAMKSHNMKNSSSLTMVNFFPIFLIFK